MGQFGQLKDSRVGRPLGLSGEGWIFRVEPVEKGGRLRRGRSDQAHLRRGRKKGNGWRIDDLENVKAERVEQGGEEQEAGDRHLPPARTFPVEKEITVRLRVSRRAHGCRLVASATEVIPRSSAAFVTAITRS